MTLTKEQIKEIAEKRSSNDYVRSIAERCIREALELAEKSNAEAPEGCYLVAVHDGEGWGLYVHNAAHEVIAILDWPDVYGEYKTSEDLAEMGFEIA